MSCPFNETQLTDLKTFVELCQALPQVLHHPKLSFFKDYLVSMGATIPEPTGANFKPAGDSNTAKTAEDTPMSSEEGSEPESDIELNMEGVIQGDTTDTTQFMGDLETEPSDEERDQSDEKRTEAMKAFSEQEYETAIKLYTEAIQLNPQSALLFAKRGQVYLKMNKPNACIKDCTRALELNCDSAAAYKFRGRAYRLLGCFEEASHDLCESLKIDYDDQTNEWLSEVKPNAEKLRQHKLSCQRKKEEKEPIEMENCLKCNSAINEDSQYYNTSNMGPDIIAIVEQNLGCEIDFDGALCSHCFEDILLSLSHPAPRGPDDLASGTFSPLQSDENYHQGSHATNVCVWCRSSLYGRRSHSLSEGPERDFIASRISPRIIPENGLLCYACWVHARRSLENQGIRNPPPANTHACVWCRRSLVQTRRHSIPEGPERTYIMSRIYPRQIPPGGQVCYACWVAARRNVQRDQNKAKFVTHP